MPGGESFYIQQLPQVKIVKEKFSIQERPIYQKRNRKKGEKVKNIEIQDDRGKDNEQQGIDITI